MEGEEKQICVPGKSNVKILKWKVENGSKISKGILLGLYETEQGPAAGKQQRLRASDNAVVESVEVDEGNSASPGDVLLKIKVCAAEPCSHPTIMKDMCAECGADLRSEFGLAGDLKECVKKVTASVAMVHSIPELRVSEQEALEIGKEDEIRLLANRKLVLLVDLDQTLIHTTNDNIPPNLKDVFHFQLRHGPSVMWYHTKFRPNTVPFLEAVSLLFELHICTFGNRMYAHTIAKFLDPDGRYFSHRILSRDECFDASTKTANLKSLFPCGDSLVCIIDDREDVWENCPNLIHVKPYRFFQGTADINAPPGLTKMENDDVPVFHRVRRTSHSELTVESEPTGVANNNTKIDKDSNVENESQSESVVTTEMELVAVNKQDQHESVESDLDAEEHVSLEKRDISESGNCCEKVVDKNMTDIDSGQPHCELVNTESERTEQDMDSNESKNITSESEHISATEDEQMVLDNDVKEDEETDLKDRTEDTENDRTEVSDKLDNDLEKLSKMKDGKSDENEIQDDIEWEDDDDYLWHLEEILKRIHRAYYEIYDQMKSKGDRMTPLPSVKNVIPYVKRKVLKGVRILFSGVVPLHKSQEQTRIYQVANSLGAEVHNSLVPRTKSSKGEATTHVVAAKMGTIKVKQAQKMRGIAIVNPDWLWTCNERWEKVDERLFPVKDKAEDSPKLENMKEKTFKKTAHKKRKAEGSGDQNSKKSRKMNLNSKTEMDNCNEFSKEKFLDSKREATSNKEKALFAEMYNPLYVFSDADIELMDKEVEEGMRESEGSSCEDDEERNERLRKQVLGDVSDTSDDSLSGDFPLGWKVKKPRSESPSGESEDETRQKNNTGYESENDVMVKYEGIVDAFAPHQSSESGNTDNDSIGSVDDEIADAVQKEFLGAL